MENNTVIKRKKWNKEAVFGLIASVIPLIGFVLFSLVPLMLICVTMFVDMDGFMLDTMVWNNFANFAHVFTDPVSKFPHALGVSFILTLPHMLGLVIALIISALINQKVPGAKGYRVLFFIPYICSSVAIAIMWRWVFDPNMGMFNDVLVRFGGKPISWFNEASAYTSMLLIIMVWQAPSYGIVMFAAAFTSVNPALYEAAKIDGATRSRQFFAITLPAISPTSFYLLTAGLIAGLQTFDIAYVFGGNSWTGDAGPDNAGLTAILHIYNTGITFRRMPEASVMSLFLFVIIFIVLALNYVLSKKWVSYD